MSSENYWKRRTIGRRTVLAGAAGAGALALAGCGDDDKPSTGGGSTPSSGQFSATKATGTTEDKPVRGGTIVMNQGTSLQDVWDPHFSVATAAQIWAFIGNLMLRPNRDGTKLEGELIEKWESPSDTEYAFTVRQGVKWHNKAPTNGRVMNAADIAFSLNRIAGKLGGATKASLRASTLANMESATAVDDKTVRVKMSAPNSGFLGGISEWRNQAVSKDYVEGGGDFKDPTKLVGTGAWIIEKAEDLKEHAYVRHPDYWEAGKPYADALKRTFIADRLSAATAFIKGDLSIFEDPNKAEEQTIPAQMGKNMREETWISGTWYHFRYNTTKKEFSDPRVRRALQLALDYGKLHDAVFGKGRWELCGPVPSVFAEGLTNAELAKLPGFNQATKDADIKTAKDLMTAAGYADGGFSFKIMPPDQLTHWFDLGVRAADQWKSVWPAMNVEIDPAGNLTTFGTRHTNAQFDMSSYRFAVAPDAVPEAQVSYHSKGSRNYGKFGNPAIDAFLDKALIQLKTEERKATLLAMQKALLEEHMPLIPLDVYQYVAYFQAKIQGMSGFGSRLAANTDDTKKHWKDAWFKA